MPRRWRAGSRSAPPPRAAGALLDQSGQQAGERLEEAEVGPAERAAADGLDVEHADDLLVPDQRHRAHRGELCLVHAADPGETLVEVDIEVTRLPIRAASPVRPGRAANVPRRSVRGQGRSSRPASRRSRRGPSGRASRRRRAAAVARSMIVPSARPRCGSTRRRARPWQGTTAPRCAAPSPWRATSRAMARWSRRKGERSRPARPAVVRTKEH